MFIKNRKQNETIRDQNQNIENCSQRFQNMSFNAVTDEAQNIMQYLNDDNVMVEEIDDGDNSNTEILLESENETSKSEA
jgi:hypothetical protein